MDLGFSLGGVLYGISESPEVSAPSIEGSATTSTTVAPAAVVQPGSVHLVTFNLGTGAVADLGAIGTALAELGRGGEITFDSVGNLYV